MIYIDNNEYKLMPFLAKFTQHNESHEQYVIDKSELKAFEQMGYITELVFEEVVHEPDVLERLEEVKDFPEEEYQVVVEYVTENKIQAASRLALMKQNETLEESIIELSMMLTGGL